MDKLRLPLKPTQKFVKQVSEHNLKSINQKHNFYSLREVLAFKIFNMFCSKFKHLQVHKKFQHFPVKKVSSLYRHNQVSALELQQQKSFSTKIQTISFSIHPSHNFSALKYKLVSTSDFWNYSFSRKLTYYC